MLPMRRIALGLSTSVFCLSLAGAAHAAGFQLKEQSSSMQGHAFAGASAKADDASTLFFNPAGMTRLEGTQIDLQAALIAPRAEFTPTAVTANAVGAPSPTIADNDGGDAGVAAVVPSFYAARELVPDWHIGIAVNTPFGLATKYSNGWAGRYYALESDLMTVNVAPTLAYKINDQLFVGANVQAQYIEAKLTAAVDFGVGDGLNKLKGDDMGYGYGLGLLWQPRQDTRVGVNYRSRIVHELDGDIRVTNAAGATVLNVGATADVTTPDILSVGLVHDINPQWTLLGELAWTNWSLFDRLVVVDDTGTVRQNVNEDWHDTIFASLGAEYKHSDAWTFRGGVAYDEGAVDTDTRTFRIPESDRFWTSLGASFAFSPMASLDMSYTHIFARDSRVLEDDQPATAGTVAGTFDAGVDIATVGVSFKF